MYSPIRDKYPQGGQLTIGELLRYAVAESDGTASDVLLKLAGGSSGVMSFLNEINVSGFNVVNSEKEIGRDWQTQYENWATPKGAVELLAALQTPRGLSAGSQAFLLKLMTESIPGAKRLKGQLPRESSSRTRRGRAARRTALPLRLTISESSRCPMARISPLPFSSPILQLTTRRAKASSRG